MNNQHCGYVAIIGRPNVGKSTLMNHILGQKLSITCKKPQTTRHQILGIKTKDNVQVLYVDTPGMHLGRKKALNRYLNRTAKSMMQDVDVIVFMIDALVWTEEEEAILEVLKTVKSPVILAINKTDLIKDKATLLPEIERLSKLMNFKEIMPVSAKCNWGMVELEKTVADNLPEAPFFYEEDRLTDRPEKFFVAEIIREKLTRLLGQEVPYSITVEIERFEEEGHLARIHAAIYVERPSQKAIIIGKQGEKLKEIGTSARRDIEKFIDKKVYLELWVKVKAGWSDDENALQKLGYA